MRIDQVISYGYLSTMTIGSQPAFLATNRLLIRSGQPPACQLSLRPSADYGRIIDHPTNFSDLNRDSDQPVSYCSDVLTAMHSHLTDIAHTYAPD